MSRLRSLWSRLRRAEDPYEAFFLQAEATDPRNLMVNRIQGAPEGSVFAVKTETHTPEVMSSHMKELGAFFEADVVRVVAANSLDPEPAEPADVSTAGDGLPFAILMLFHAEHDRRDSPGIGGHATALKAAFATFQVSAIIREYGFQARRVSPTDPDRAAASAGLGRLDTQGRLAVPGFGDKVLIADVILTDLPLAPDA